MRPLRYIMAAAVLAALLPGSLQGKPVVAEKAYMFGFIANFSDSVVYFTDIQTVDSVWYDHKTKFLLGRSSYAYQLRDYFANKLSMPHRTCIVIYGLTRKEAEKKYLKLRKRYTVKNAGKFDVRNLNENEFHFQTVNVSPEEETTPAPKKEKRTKKGGDGKRPPRDGNRPPKR